MAHDAWTRFRRSRQGKTQTSDTESEPHPTPPATARYVARRRRVRPRPPRAIARIESDAGSGTVFNVRATLFSESAVIELLFGFNTKLSVMVNDAEFGENVLGPFGTVCDDAHDETDGVSVSNSVVAVVPTLNAALAVAVDPLPDHL
jgi:hypothetical protein